MVFGFDLNMSLRTFGCVSRRCFASRRALSSMSSSSAVGAVFSGRKLREHLSCPRHFSTDLLVEDESALDSIIREQRKKVDDTLTRDAMLQVNDPEVIFESVYAEMKKRNNGKDLVFPREVIWLIGAPGSG